jgi:hypothetical protein
LKVHASFPQDLTENNFNNTVENVLNKFGVGGSREVGIDVIFVDPFAIPRIFYEFYF